MERLGGFRLCRRLPDTDGRLLPFLSVEAMVGTMLEGRTAQASRGAAGPEGMETLAPGKAVRHQHQPAPCGLRPSSREMWLDHTWAGWRILGSVSDFHLHFRLARVSRILTLALVPLWSLCFCENQTTKEAERSGCGQSNQWPECGA